MRQDTMKRGRWLVWLAVLIFLVLLPSGLAFAQVDMTGMWAPVGYRPDSPDMGDYTGFPLSRAGQQRAETWAANVFEIAQNVCRPYPLEDPFGPAQLRMWKDVNNTTQDVIAQLRRRQIELPVCQSGLSGASTSASGAESLRPRGACESRAAARGGSHSANCQASNWPKSGPTLTLV